MLSRVADSRQDLRLSTEVRILPILGRYVLDVC